MAGETVYWIWLAQRLGSGSKYVRAILDRFGSAFEVYQAAPEAFSGLDFGRCRVLSALADKNLTDAVKIYDDCKRLGVDVIPIDDARYPARLRAIMDAPTVIYCRGKLPDFGGRLCIGVVGTRKMSEYGCRAAYKISYELAVAGAITVSGMALGVDSVVAAATLAAGGHTVAVLGCGIDVVYPAANRKIYNELLSKGTIISEYPPQTSPTRFTFPQRNRIISGLSQGTFVVEGDMKSGAMITARDALIQGRELFALPGNVGEANSNGTNTMIREGAHPVVSAEDILREFLPLYRDTVDISRINRGDRNPNYDRDVLAKYGIVFGFDCMMGERGLSPVITQNQVKEKKKPAKVPAPAVKTAEAKVSDGSNEAYKILDPALRAVYDRIPSDSAVSIDRLTGNGLGVGDVISALTLLEIEGLVTSLPGGLYSKV